MKAFSASLLTLLLALVPLTASPADTEKTLQNVKGSVVYGPGDPPSNKLAIKAAATLNDSDYAQTLSDSLATITLPDSSQILMGQNSSVQMVSFNQTDIAHAKFIVRGKMRFTVNHPSGAQADYHFQTTTGEIAVRGTVGDIFANPAGGLQVNVYALSTPTLPVQVTLVNGQVFTLAAGQSLVATAAAGAVTASVTGVTQSMFTPFSELGAPVNAGSLGITGAAAGAGAGAAGATAGIVAGAAAAAAAVTTISNNNTSTPSPAPSPTPTPTNAPTPQPSTTSVPITVNKA
ncbi:MAG: FecR family protein, partial [Candidatus Aquilonibacter sp.]